MTQHPPAGLGRKRPQLNVAIGRLHLDPDNPRLPENIQGKAEDTLRQHLLSHFDLEEIALPMGQNGYFDEEPLVAIPHGVPQNLIPELGQRVSQEYLDFIKAPQTQFTVVEGNRRLATAQLLSSEELRQQLRNL